jgi:phage host-nuclease inhibitor protein Gam
MNETVSDVDWEIKQLEAAIQYYQKGVRDALTIDEAEKYTATIMNLTNQIRLLKRRKDGL